MSQRRVLAAVFLLGAAGSGRLIYGIVTATEAPSQALAMMKYFALAVLVIATVYSGAKLLTTMRSQKPSNGRVD
jgi:hypothetical protein